MKYIKNINFDYLKIKIKLSKLIFIFLIIRVVIADDIYPNDQHKMNDLISGYHNISEKSISITNIERMVKYKIEGMDGEFVDTILEMHRSRLVTLMYKVEKINVSASEIGQNEAISLSDDFQSLLILLDQFEFIKSDVEYISDFARVYEVSLSNKNDESIKKRIAFLIKKKSASLFNKLIIHKHQLKKKVDFKKIKSAIILPRYIDLAETYSKIMDESKVLFDLISNESNIKNN